MGLATGVLEHATLAGLLASGAFDRHIRSMAVQHRRRRDHLAAAPAEALPSWKASGTAADLHLVVHPPSGHDEVAMAAEAQACGQDARPLSSYAVEPRDAPGLVLGFGHRSPTVLISGVADLATLAGDGNRA